MPALSQRRNAGYGISIENLDNPGWHVTVDLAGTELQWRESKEFAIERTSEDWVRCKIVGTREAPKYEAHGDKPST